mmetsp:Transcript_24569/g.68387  ORF Transcript_24569/g.68387 Transcript_24569/m.68387 type:complete len:230 (-) Transcript_24569:388-1077(-)
MRPPCMCRRPRRRRTPLPHVAAPRPPSHLHFAYDVFETLELSIAVPNSSAHVSQTLGEIVDGLGHWHHALGCSAGCCFEPLLCDRAVFQHLGPHRSKFFDELAHLFPALCTSFAQSLLQVPNASPFRPAHNTEHAARLLFGVLPQALALRLECSIKTLLLGIHKVLGARKLLSQGGEILCRSRMRGAQFLQLHLQGTSRYLTFGRTLIQLRGVPRRSRFNAFGRPLTRR